VRKAKRAGALYGGREPGCGELKTLGSSFFLIARSKGAKSERGQERGGRSLFWGSTEGDAREVEKLRRAGGPDPN